MTDSYPLKADRGLRFVAIMPKNWAEFFRAIFIFTSPVFSEAIETMPTLQVSNQPTYELITH